MSQKTSRRPGNPSCADARRRRAQRSKHCLCRRAFSVVHAEITGSPHRQDKSNSKTYLDSNGKSNMFTPCLARCRTTSSTSHIQKGFFRECTGRFHDVRWQALRGVGSEVVFAQDASAGRRVGLGHIRDRGGPGLSGWGLEPASECSAGCPRLLAPAALAGGLTAGLFVGWLACWRFAHHWAGGSVATSPIAPVRRGVGVVARASAGSVFRGGVQGRRRPRSVDAVARQV